MSHSDSTLDAGAICNLYSVTKPHSSIRDLAKAMVDDAGNLPRLSGQSLLFSFLTTEPNAEGAVHENAMSAPA